MSLLARRLIFYSLFLMFLISAPVLVAYTAGYRYHFKQNRIVKIGAISVKTEPQGASVSLNGKVVDDRTPILINNLSPGVYTLEIYKDEFHTWRKNLRVASGQTTFAHSVPLFKNAEPKLNPNGQNTIRSDIPKFPQSLNEYKVFYDTKLGRIVVINNATRTRVAEFYGTNAIWRAKDTPRLFVYSSHEVWQYDPQENHITLITRLLDPIRDVIPIAKLDALVMIVHNEVRAVELDQRDRQNSWTLAAFDEIKTAALSGDGKILEIFGTYEGQEGMWELKLK